MTYIIIGIIVIGIILFFTKNSKSESNQDEFFINTATQSADRIEKLGLNRSSEDVSYILDESKLQFPKIENKEEKVEYKAEPSREWIIELVIPDGAIIKQKKLYELFDYEWRTNFSSTIFGHSPEDDRWTYALAGGTPETYNQIQVAVNLLDVFNDENPNYDIEKLERYIIELKKRLKSHSLAFKIKETESKESAIEKSKKLVELNRLFDRDILIGLQSDKIYDGREVWDVLQSLGLKWGDGDLFHWNNSSDYASDQHFSVWTSTEPGYFLPEQIKKGKMNPSNLVFGFSIPRSADPINVYRVLVNSVKYSQKRLGGEITNRNGEPFNEQLELIQLAELIKQMDDNGIIPGSSNSLRLY
ncbi:cell division protein ZipA C-terminal FtsZ-binding domain-containing protein [uncultured Aquimarina sp.]|uniref:cell division protein ZipA C-terminal FtsZ-binding domain-containing protein n=1 Tax=uncultured Aquimarina sp. TaxID=575652 RepID=UPI002616D1D5|nr:cell division protein ZipA C-terminal FtsZ-binding domain-containing protein [uncultured Aquimarina sp.]